MVSIIVPVYNAEKYLAKTIESILGQTYADIEIILVNDGSTDSSNEIITQYKKTDNRIVHIDSENHGAPYARNLGIECARGEYVLFFDADDMMRSNAVEVLYDTITAANADLAIGSRTHIDETDCIIAHVIEKTACYTLPHDYKSVLYMDQLPDNKLFKMSVIREQCVRFSDLKIGQDANFVLKYLSVCYKVAVSDIIVCDYRLVRGSISHVATEKVLDIVNCFNDAEQFIKQHINNETLNCLLNDIRILHFKTQFAKYTFAKDKETRKKIFYVMHNEIEKIAKELNYSFSDRASECYAYVKKKYQYRIITLSGFYCFLRKRKYKNVF